MNGRIVSGGIVAIALAIGAAMWFSINRVHYEEVRDVASVRIQGDEFAVQNYRGIDGESSPLKLRACFDVDWEYYPSSAHQEEATPLIAPNWFDCFDAEALQADITSGDASVILAEENMPFGFSSYIAQYANGQAYMWRQINACGRAKIAGESLPEGCGEEAQADSWNKVFVTGLDGTAEELLVVEGSLRGAGSLACFETPLSLALITETYELGEAARWPGAAALACFPDTLETDVTDGAALIVKGGEAGQFVAIYGDGRGFVWKGQN